MRYRMVDVNAAISIKSGNRPHSHRTKICGGNRKATTTATEPTAHVFELNPSFPLLAAARPPPKLSSYSTLANDFSSHSTFFAQIAPHRHCCLREPKISLPLLILLLSVVSSVCSWLWERRRIKGTHTCEWESVCERKRVILLAESAVRWRKQ